MAKQLADDESNIRRKQRRRLVGAIALTLAVVVILPMTLDSEPKSTLSDIDLRIPDPEKVGEFVPGVAIPESAMTPSAPAAGTGAEPGAGTTSGVAPAAVAAVPATTAVKEALPVKDAKSDALAKPQATPVKPPAAKPADKPAGAVEAGYVAQVGAYANADAAKQESARLKQWGFKAYTEKSGDKTRVRVGPYPTREKAETVGKQLEKRGMQPVILSAK
ncbi:MAG TPA: SPOR domain-containing protein [Gallionella sp.]